MASEVFARQPTRIEKSDAIRDAAFRLFLAKGYAATSYTDIAKEAGCKRSLVQYYFPKKDELLTELVDQLLELTDEFFESTGAIGGRTRFEEFYVTGQMHFYLLLKCEDMRPLAQDILSSRVITGTVIDTLRKWIAGSEELEGIPPERISTAMAMAMGGAYETAYGILVGQAREVDVAQLAEWSIRVFFLVAAMDEGSFCDGLASHKLSDSELEEASTAILKRVASDH